ncbi:MAG: SPOR domain-containing protein [Candidatus Krumholzibacteria bacterium]|nr:SPOR domain-containing protein [Candidatus Krumholzibacteria bacterium]
MTGRTGSIRIASAATGIFVLSLILAGCAPREMAKGAGGTAARDDAPAAKGVEGARDTARASYDIEDEMPEKSPQRPAQLIERLEPAKPDSISVQDVAVEESPKQRYDVGYRIQVFASGDRAAAERIREKIVAETAMNAYLEYEDGLYKVRAGDFAERTDAAQARLKLAGAYPGSWIVRTTIRR